MNILDRILADKRKEVQLKSSLIPVSQFEKSALFEKPCHSLAAALKYSATGIIAEYKRRSPSKQTINQNTNVGIVAKGYEKGGVSEMSIHNDNKY